MPKQAGSAEHAQPAVRVVPTGLFDAPKGSPMPTFGWSCGPLGKADPMLNPRGSSSQMDSRSESMHIVGSSLTYGGIVRPIHVSTRNEEEMRLAKAGKEAEEK